MAPPFGLIPWTRQLLVKWQLQGAACLLVILALGFLAYATDLWLMTLLSPAAAAGATGGLLILAALAVIGIAAIVSACAPKAIPRKSDFDPLAITEMAATLIDLGKKLDGELRLSAKPLTIGALLLGCALGYSPALRRTLKDLIDR